MKDYQLVGTVPSSSAIDYGSYSAYIICPGVTRDGSLLYKTLLLDNTGHMDSQLKRPTMIPNGWDDLTDRSIEYFKKYCNANGIVSTQA
jgi:hypothetical protein